MWSDNDFRCSAAEIAEVEESDALLPRGGVPGNRLRQQIERLTLVARHHGPDAEVVRSFSHGSTSNTTECVSQMIREREKSNTDVANETGSRFHPRGVPSNFVSSCASAVAAESATGCCIGGRSPHHVAGRGIVDCLGTAVLSTQYSGGGGRRTTTVGGGTRNF